MSIDSFLLAWVAKRQSLSSLVLLALLISFQGCCRFLVFIFLLILFHVALNVSLWLLDGDLFLFLWHWRANGWSSPLCKLCRRRILLCIRLLYLLNEGVRIWVAKNFKHFFSKVSLRCWLEIHLLVESLAFLWWY